MKVDIENIQQLGQAIRQVRKAQRLTQQDLSLTANTAPRFISDLENGKPTCQIGKALQVARCLGISVTLSDRP
ncbi:MAG: helix-turn-helix domain-containing protein [Puniceicoccaceae bacterium]